LAHASTICYNYFSCFEYAEKYHSVAFQSIIIEKQHVMVLYATTHTWGESGTIDRKSHRVVPLGKMCHPLKGLVHLKKKKKT